jgi:F-type H+-transporting ATPase subunit b
MVHSVLHTVAAGPLIDFDNTALIQLVIFTVVGLAASRLLFRPYLKMREERSAGIEGARAEAERLSAQADAQMADYETKLAEARRRADSERRQVRSEAAQHQQEITDKARSEAVSALSSAKQQVSDKAQATRDELLPRAEDIGAEIASRLLGRKVA